MKKQQQSLKEWQKMFEEIYQEKDRRHYTSSDLLLHIVEKTSAIAESLRKEDGTFEISLAEFFSWLMAFGSNEKINMERAIFEKYHGTCPY